MSEYDNLKAQKNAIVAREKAEAGTAIGLAVYARLSGLAHKNNQVVGEKNNYYVTLQQLEQAFVDLFQEMARQP